MKTAEDPLDLVHETLEALTDKVAQLSKSLGRPSNQRDIEDSLDDLTEVIRAYVSKPEPKLTPVVVPAPVVNVAPTSVSIPPSVVTMPEIVMPSPLPRPKGAVHNITAHDPMTGRISRIETTFIY